MELPIGFDDRQVGNACDAALHKPVFVQLPILVPVRTEPVSITVVTFLGEAHCDSVVRKGPEFLDQPIVELPLPLAGQEGFNL